MITYTSKRFFLSTGFSESNEQDRTYNRYAQVKRFSPEKIMATKWRASTVAEKEIPIFPAFTKTSCQGLLSY